MILTHRTVELGSMLKHWTLNDPAAGSVARDARVTWLWSSGKLELVWAPLMSSVLGNVSLLRRR